LAYVRGARTLILAALVLYAIFGTIFILAGTVLGDVGVTAIGISRFLFLVLVYALLYSPLRGGMLPQAPTRALVLGIVSFFIGGIETGILLLIASYKLRRAIVFAIGPGPHPAEVPPPAEVGVLGGGLESPQPVAEAVPEEKLTRFCPTCGSALAPPYRFCTNCGARIR
jgi:hypothetical protein